MFFKFKLLTKIIRLWVFPFVFLNFFLITDLYAQQNPDTLRILTTEGNPGDTVELEIDMYNHSAGISGIQLGIAYDENILYPLDIHTTYRTSFFETLPNVWAPLYDTTMHGVDPGQIRLIAYVWGPPPLEYVPIGRGPICSISFLILEDAQNVYSEVRFEAYYPGDNTLSDPEGSAIIPLLFDGSVIVGGGGQGQPPEFDASNPLSMYNAYEGIQLQFSVIATDQDNDYMSLNCEGIPQNASFYTVNQEPGFIEGNFIFTPNSEQVNDTITVRFIASDDAYERTKSVNIYIHPSGDFNRSPIINPIPSQTVTEGFYLEIEVTAYDPDGDIVTLEASNLPLNSDFPFVQGDSSVSGIFSFWPDFDQGPDTIFVNFTAKDDHNNVSSLNLQIIILDAPNEFIEVIPGSGGLPGALDRFLTVNLINANPIYGLQFDFIYDPEVLDIGQVIASERVYDLAFFDTLLEDGRYRVMIFSFGGETIESGSGEIVRFEVGVYQNAFPGQSIVTFDSATSVQDSVGASKNIIYEPGIFTVDVLGDANLDGLVSVGDCVAVVASLLGRIEFGVRAADAADYNRDGDVRIADLMEIVNHILGRTPSPSPPFNVAGSIELIREGLYFGARTQLPLWLSLNEEGAAVQFTIDYDPTLIKVNGLTNGPMISGLVFDYQDTGEKINGVIYDLDLSVFGPAIGELVNLDVEVIGDVPEPARALRLSDFEVVNKDAQALNIQVLGELPSSFTLYQNYPNPFNAYTTIAFDLPSDSYVKVTLYNILGQVVTELSDVYLEAGSHQLVWDGTDSEGKYVTSGVYFYRLQANEFDQTRKMLLMK